MVSGCAIYTRAGEYLLIATAAQVDKYEAGIFGSCPRVYCNGCNIVPCGRSDLPGLDTVKLFCPNCNDIYTPPSSRFQGVDGTYAHHLLLRVIYKRVHHRCFLWHDFRTSLLPELPRACTRPVLEALYAPFYLPTLFRKLVLQPTSLREP